MASERAEKNKGRVYTAAGAICVGLAAIGIVVPVMPTIPFLLLAAGFFAKGSPRAYQWLMTNPVFGPLLKNYSEGKGLSTKAKTISVLGVIAFFSISIVLIGFDLLMSAVLIAIAAAVTIYILRLPNADAKAHQE